MQGRAADTLHKSQTNTKSRYSLRYVSQRIHAGAVDPQFQVQVIAAAPGAIHVAGVAHVADDLPLGHSAALADGNAAQVGIQAVVGYSGKLRWH